MTDTVFLTYNIFNTKIILSLLIIIINNFFIAFYLVKKVFNLIVNMETLDLILF